MATSVHELRLAELSELVARRMGLFFPQTRWRDLERGISAAALELGFEDPDSCIERFLISSFTKPQLEVLASHLTVGETHFFRERKSFEALAERVLPDHVKAAHKNAKRLRIWSAGCATGEEPYSVAILVSQLIPDISEWNITILATDINPRFLRRAEEAVYTSWSFRDCPPEVQERYFQRVGKGRLKLIDDIRRMVTFSYLNLAEDLYPSLMNNTAGMDLILCRNVLMYFAPEQARRTIQRLCGCLVEGGWLLVSPCEASHTLFSEFAAVSLPGAILFRKGAQRSIPLEGPPVVEIEHCVAAATLADDSLPPLLPAAFPVEQSSAQKSPEVIVEPAEGLSPSAFEEARVHYNQGRYDEAAAALLLHLENQPANADAMALLARTRANQGRLEEARTWCEKAIRTDKLRAALHYLHAMILQEQGDEAHAKEGLRHALYLDSGLVLAHVALGNLCRRQGRAGDSRKHFQNALALLRSCPLDEPVPESEGMTSGRMVEIIQLTV